ncbi:MAG TPA: DoxX family protein [Steroidobacteraceae bacterium]|nr:DoxX family protein [Steroidobacteraceae bacterium]
MNAVIPLRSLNRSAARVAARVEDVFLLALRLYVSWQFLKSGWLKLQDWETTQFLFEEEYRVPLLSPAVAAVLGTAGELVFPLGLAIGLLGRYAAVGLWCVNALAVVAYAHVLFAEGFEGAIAQHYLWGVVLLALVVFGPGRISADGWLERGEGNVRHRRAR